MLMLIADHKRSVSTKREQLSMTAVRLSNCLQSVYHMYARTHTHTHTHTHTRARARARRERERQRQRIKSKSISLLSIGFLPITKGL